MLVYGKRAKRHKKRPTMEVVSFGETHIVFMKLTASFAKIICSYFMKLRTSKVCFVCLWKHKKTKKHKVSLFLGIQMDFISSTNWKLLHWRMNPHVSQNQDTKHYYKQQCYTNCFVLSLKSDKTSHTHYYVCEKQ